MINSHESPLHNLPKYSSHQIIKIPPLFILGNKLTKHSIVELYQSASNLNMAIPLGDENDFRLSLNHPLRIVKCWAPEIIMAF